MKKLFVILILFLVFKSYSQEYFINQNNEKCIKLYYIVDAIDSMRVYLVVEPFYEWEIKILQQWDQLTRREKVDVTQRFALLGRRVEIEKVKPIYYKNDSIQ